MKKIAICVMILAVVLFTAGCTTTEVRETKETKVYGPNVQPTPNTPGMQPSGPTGIVHENTTTDGSSSDPEWINQTEMAVGMVAIDMSRPKGQAIAMAKRGAQIEAQRQILEKVLGLRIDSQTTVRDLVTESDKIDAQSSGLVRGAQVIGEAPDYANGVYKVTVELKLYDVWYYMKEEKHYIK